MNKRRLIFVAFALGVVVAICVLLNSRSGPQPPLEPYMLVGRVSEIKNKYSSLPGDTRQRCYIETSKGEYGVIFRPETPIRDDTGGTGEVQVGQTIKVWNQHPGVVAATDPPIVYAKFIVIEASIDWDSWLIPTSGLVAVAGITVLILALLKWFRRSQRWLRDNP